MKVKVKKLNPKATLPQYAKNGDAAADLVAINREWNKEGQFYEYYTGLAVEIPFGHVGLIFPRSSISNKELFLTNSVGVIDAGYRGEIKFRFKETSSMDPVIYEIGDKIGQLIIMPHPRIEFTEVGELSETERGTGAFGSSGK